MNKTYCASTVQALMDALATPEIEIITIAQDLHDVPPLTLPPGKELRGTAGSRPGLFFTGRGGVRLTENNCLSNLRLCAPANSAAVMNDSDRKNFGRLSLEDIAAIGQVKILINAQSATGCVEVRGLHIEAAHTVDELPQPKGFGVSVLQGAFTLWIMQAGAAAAVTANLLDISIGSSDAPVQGGGIFVAGAGHGDLTLRVDRLRTGAVYCDGRIPAGTADRISGGVFVLHGSNVDSVENEGPVMTFGANDMALDNWGSVERWTARAEITTFGPSGIGFVNFGQLNSLQIDAPIETHGQGARGFNVYSGKVGEAVFERIVTRGDGAVGLQISQPVDALRIHRGIETFGGTGRSLVEGVQQELKAVALSIKRGGSGREVLIEGGLITHGDGVPALEQAGYIETLSIAGGFGGQRS